MTKFRVHIILASAISLAVLCTRSGKRKALMCCKFEKRTIYDL